jgi:hypothetical protein
MTTFRADIRAAAVTLLKEYAADVNLELQVYPGRPRSIHPPTAFVDRIHETVAPRGVRAFQRTPVVDIVILHGQFDSKDAVDQADAFVDGFLSWVYARVHAAGANTEVAIVGTDDDPTYVSDWQPPEVQRTYFATVLSLEGYAGE